MIEIFLIFASLVVTPIILCLPFVAYNSYKESQEVEAVRIMDALRGIKRGRTSSTGMR